MVDQPPWKKPRPCKDCGGLFEPKWSSSRRCDLCYEVARKSPPAIARQVRPRRTAPRPPLPGVRTCVTCGLDFPAKWPGTRRCDACHASRAAIPGGSLERVRERLPPVARVCLGCGETLNRFPTALRCEKCVKDRRREVKQQSRGRNREVYRRYARNWRAGNRERDRSNRRDWTGKNRERLTTYKRDYDNQRKRTDHVFKLVCTVRSRIATALSASRLKGRRVTARGALRYLGCPFDDFARHIESQFTDGMSWENFGKSGWHVDHIYPLGRADLTDPVELLAAFNWRNCRPLWGVENMVKQATVTPEAAALFAELKALLAAQQL